MTKPELIVVANASQARLFRRETHPDVLVPLATEQHPEGRLKASELASDHLGHGAADTRPGGVSFAPRVDPKRKEDLAFAKTVSAHLEAALADGAYAGVAVFASSPFLGELKGRLGAHAQKALLATVDSDLTSFGLDELERRVGQALAPSH